MATTTVENTPVGTLHVDIFDGQTKKVIWHGTSTDTLSGKPEKNEEKLTKEVAETILLTNHRKFGPVELVTPPCGREPAGRRASAMTRRAIARCRQRFLSICRR
jgi:hypothetical protein